MIDQATGFAAMPASFVRLERSELAYRVIGRGPPLLLVHGYPLDGRTFRYLVPALSTRFTLFVPDLHGAGETRCAESADFTFAGQVRALRAFVAAMKLGEYGIFAHDTGATIARYLAIEDPSVNRLVLLGTEIPHHRPPWIPFLQRTSHPDRTVAIRTLMRFRWFRRSNVAFGGCFNDLRLIDGDFKRLFVDPLIASKARARAAIRYLRGIDFRMVDALEEKHAGIRAPTLLIWGEEDTVFPVDLARAMGRRMPSCRGFVTVPGARLFAHEERPDEVACHALSFLAPS